MISPPPSNCSRRVRAKAQSDRWSAGVCQAVAASISLYIRLSLALSSMGCRIFRVQFKHSQRKPPGRTLSTCLPANRSVSGIRPTYFTSPAHAGQDGRSSGLSRLGLADKKRIEVNHMTIGAISLSYVPCIAQAGLISQSKRLLEGALPLVQRIKTDLDNQGASFVQKV